MLHSHYGHIPALSRFFQGTLDVPDAVPEDVLEELIKRRQATDLTTNLSVAADIYSYIRDNTVRDEEWQILRYVFLLYFSPVNSILYSFGSNIRCLHRYPRLSSGIGKL